MNPISKIAVAATTLLSILLISFQVFGNRMPAAPVVTAAEIQALQADSNGSAGFVLVDVRAKAESDVSIIPGAITRAEFERAKQNYQGKTVITYCTVGYRSGIYAQKLRKAGWDARNYEGSILDWCAQGLPVVTQNGQQTKRVHTYDSHQVLAAGYQQVF